MYRHGLMCAVNAYNKENIPMTDDASSGGDIPIRINSFKEACISLGKTIKFIDSWLQYFEDNYDKIFVIYKEKTVELFKTIPK